MYANLLSIHSPDFIQAFKGNYCMFFDNCVSRFPDNSQQIYTTLFDRHMLHVFSFLMKQGLAPVTFLLGPLYLFEGQAE